MIYFLLEDTSTFAQNGKIIANIFKTTYYLKGKTTYYLHKLKFRTVRADRLVRGPREFFFVGTVHSRFPIFSVCTLLPRGTAGT